MSKNAFPAWAPPPLGNSQRSPDLLVRWGGGTGDVTQTPPTQRLRRLDFCDPAQAMVPLRCFQAGYDADSAASKYRFHTQ